MDVKVTIPAGHLRNIQIPRDGEMLYCISIYKDVIEKTAIGMYKKGKWIKASNHI